ncbi:MAG: hypothetical protein U0797_14750 [Gemmataceae bacterium]
MREVAEASRTSSADAVLLAERFADGLATAHQLAAARFGGWSQPGHVAWPVCWPPDVDHFQMMQRALAWVTGFTPAADSRRAETRLAAIVREIVGPPAHSPRIDPAWTAWNDGTVVKMAGAIYEERTYDHMPILGDALEEAGCADPAILQHCQTGDRHHRGCWLLDAILNLG